MSPNQLFLYIISWIGLFITTFFLLSFFEHRHKLNNPKPSKLVKVTIAVPVYNGEKYLKKTVDSILALNYPRALLQIIIVDDGSTDSTLSLAQQYTKKGVLVISQKNGGKGVALNTALQHATGEIFGCLDVDSFASPDALLKMVGYFKEKEVMAVTPSLKVYEPHSFLQRVQAIEFLLGVYLRKAFSFVGSIHVTPGPFTLYRKWFFDTYGGYNHPNLTEDIEIALRIQSHHYVIENAMDASVYTMGVKEFKPLLKQRLRWYKGFVDNVLNYSHLFSKRYGNLGMFILPSSFISVALAITAVLWGIIRSIQHLFRFFVDFRAFNYEWSYFFRWNFEPFFFNSDPIFVLGMMGLVLSITTILLAKLLSNEKQKIEISYIFFVASYLFLFSFWWLIAIYYKLIGKKIKWGDKEL